MALSTIVGYIEQTNLTVALRPLREKSLLLLTVPSEFVYGSIKVLCSKVAPDSFTLFQPFFVIMLQRTTAQFDVYG